MKWIVVLAIVVLLAGGVQVVHASLALQDGDGGDEEGPTAGIVYGEIVSDVISHDCALEGGDGSVPPCAPIPVQGWIESETTSHDCALEGGDGSVPPCTPIPVQGWIEMPASFGS